MGCAGSVKADYIPVGSTWLWELIWPSAVSILPWDLSICVFMGLCLCVFESLRSLPWQPNKTAGCPRPFPGQCVSVVKTCTGYSFCNDTLTQIGYEMCFSSLKSGRKFCSP